MTLTQLRFFYIFSAIFSPILACVEYDSFLIRSAAFQGLVLDGGNPVHITIQLYHNSTSQLWNFQPSNQPGLFYIINNQTGKALDFYPSGGLVLVATEKEDVLRQQWSINLDGRITNAENKRNIDIDRSNYAPGNRVILWENNGNQAQEFVIVSRKVADLQAWKEKITDTVLSSNPEEKTRDSDVKKTENSGSTIRRKTETRDDLFIRARRI